MQSTGDPPQLYHRPIESAKLGRQSQVGSATRRVPLYVLPINKSMFVFVVRRCGPPRRGRRVGVGVGRGL